MVLILLLFPLIILVVAQQQQQHVQQQQQQPPGVNATLCFLKEVVIILVFKFNIPSPPIFVTQLVQFYASHR